MRSKTDPARVESEPNITTHLGILLRFVTTVSVLFFAFVPLQTKAQNDMPVSTSIWASTTIPQTPADRDSKAVELGVKFKPLVNGYIKGVRFYKGSTNTGTHTGNLWTSTGFNLARATFGEETDSGWQEVLFETPVSVSAGSVYVASYHTPTGNYAIDPNYFATKGVTTNYLEALKEGISGSNGLYSYSPATTFPSSSFRSSNYWVDVVFTPSNGLDTIPPVVLTTAPENSATGVGVTSAVKVTFNEDLDGSSVSSSNIELRDSLNVTVPSTVFYDQATRTVTLQALQALSNAERYTVFVKGGAGGIKDKDGNPLVSNYTWSFTTVKALSPTDVFTIWSPSTIPGSITDPDPKAAELGIKFTPLTDGVIKGIRFYKSPVNTGLHTGSLWSTNGDNLAQVTFPNETETGWQEALFNVPISITAGKTYVASYHTTTGHYSFDKNYFLTGISTPYLQIPASSTEPNGVFSYTSTPAFPTSTFSASNFWVDIVFTPSTGPDVNPPVILSAFPRSGEPEADVHSQITASFNEDLNPTTVNSLTFQLTDPSNNVIPASITYSSGSRKAFLTPNSPLSYSTNYTATLKGGNFADGIKDLAGNTLAQTYTWSFTTVQASPIPPLAGPGGPILVIGSPANPFSQYPVEILRAEGFNLYTIMDLAEVTPATLQNYDVIILGELPVSDTHVSMFTDWTRSGGTFIALKPDAKLAPLLGIAPVGGTLSNKYLLVNTAASPGAGIVNKPIQYHHVADLYTLNGASSLATLYSTATAPTAYPAITANNVGTNGGQAIAFSYDLARSVVYTRQGNPEWVSQERDGESGPIRANDMFYGNASLDPKPDWNDFENIEIPQADEQQRLLANIILQGNLHRKPLPRFWYLPKGLKAAVVMTGDDHAKGGTAGRFNQYKTMSTSNTPEAVANWDAIRGTSYIYPATPLSNLQITQLQADGFEIALHLNTTCSGFTEASLKTFWNNQAQSIKSTFPGLNPLRTSRTHCMPWTDWASQAKVQAAKGVRLDVNYYYWPAKWIKDRPGMFTGSGMPMRFADLDGTLIDCYQVPTQITDESGITQYSSFINALLDKATGPEGYFGVFCANMHTDSVLSTGSNQIINSAIAHQVPVVSAKQMLDWLDGRNNSSFGSLTWTGDQLSFLIDAAAGSRNMKGMLPKASAAGALATIFFNGSPIPFKVEMIKGVEYAFFDALSGSYTAAYGVNCLANAPENVAVPAYSAATFKAKSSANNVTYQWQVSTDNGASFTNIIDSTTYLGTRNSTLTITKPNLTYNNNQYRCIISGECSITTTAAILTVVKADPTITWNAPTAITYGAALTTQQLNAEVQLPAGAPGLSGLNYTPTVGTVLGAGTQLLMVTTPETADFNSGTKTVSLVVEPRTVTGKITVHNKVYDSSTVGTIATRTLQGVLAGDIVSLQGGEAFFSTRHAGNNKTVTASGFQLGGPSAMNYRLSSDRLIGTASIIPRTVNASVAVADKAYSGTTSATILSRDVDGIFEIDTVYVWGGTASFLDPDVGPSKPATASGLRLGGIHSGNYVLASASSATTAAISPKSVSGKVTILNKIYDGSTAATISSRSLSGVLTADLSKVALEGGVAQFSNMQVGNDKRVVATGLTLTGAASKNYVLTSGTVSATASISPRPVTVSARIGQSKVVGTADPQFVYDITSGNLISGDTFMGALARIPGESVGQYQILQGSLALTSNYSLAYRGANFTISDAALLTQNTGPILKSEVALDRSLSAKIELKAFPNPFWKKAMVEFTLPNDEQRVQLDLYDLRGMKVISIYDGRAAAMQVNRFSLDGSSIPPGVYFVRLILPNQIQSFKVIMLE